MSVQSSVVCTSSPALPIPPQPDDGSGVSFDTRWAAWIERGRQHDRAVTRQVRMTSVTVAVVGLILAVFFGLTAGAR